MCACTQVCTHRGGTSSPCDAVILHHHVMSPYHCTTVSPYHCISVLRMYCRITVSLHCCTTVSQYHLALYVYHGITTSPCHQIIVSISITIQCITLCTAVSLYHHIIVSLYQHITVKTTLEEYHMLIVLSCHSLNNS